MAARTATAFANSPIAFAMLLQGEIDFDHHKTGSFCQLKMSAVGKPNYRFPEQLVAQCNQL
jgi:hypothetical protein